MAGSPLRLPRRRRSFPVLRLLSGGFVLAAIILIGIEWFRFSQTRDRLPAGAVVAGVPIGGIKISDAPAIWQAVYGESIQLDFLGSPVQLRPGDIGFTLDNDKMLADLRTQASSNTAVLADFWNYLLQRTAPTASVPLQATYEQPRLIAYLQDLAARYEIPANSGGFELNTLSFGGGKAGKRLDLEAALSAIDTALHSPTNRVVVLPMKNEAAQALEADVLKQAILSYLGSQSFVPTGPDTLFSLVLIDLKTGHELAINPNVAYSAESTIKIPIMLNLFRHIQDVSDINIKWLLAASILCSNNDASDTLISLAGNGGNIRNQLADGLAKINDTVQTVGAKNTFIIAPIEIGKPEYRFNIAPPKTAPDKSFDAKPDPFSQTTAQDMAVLLQNLYDCAEYGSGLSAAFPDGYTQSKCKQMIELLSGNIIGRMIELGVPAGTHIAHKNGWGPVLTGYNSSDAAIVYTPGGNYILSIFMWEHLQEGNPVGSIKTWETMEGISRIVYNYFNLDKPLLQSRVPENPNTAVDCVMPSPFHPERIDFTNISNGRFDADGNKVVDACVGYPDNAACFAK